MTSANVSNISVQVADNIVASTKADLNAGTSSKDFAQVMSSSFAGKVEQINANKTEMVSTVQVNQTNTKEIKSIQESSQPNMRDDKAVAEATDQVETFGQEVKEAVTEELEITDEQLAEAMEALGFTVLDLTDNSNLAVLVADLTDTDSVALLVDDSFAAIVDQVSTFTDTLLESTSFTLEELRGLALTDEGIEVVDFSIPSEQVETLEVAEFTETVEVASFEAVTTEASVKVDDKPQVIAEENPQVAATPVADTTEDVEAEQELTTSQVEVEKTADTQQKSSSDSGTSTKDDDKGTDLISNLRESNEAVAAPVATATFEVSTGEITLSTGETTDIQSVIDQIVEMAKTSTDSETTTLEMLLNPEGLGKIYMEVSQEGSEVTAKLYTQSETVREALIDQMAALQEQLVGNGTKVTSIEVAVATHEFEQNLEEGQQDHNQEAQSQQQQRKGVRNLNLNSLDELSGLMTEEEQLVAQIMRDNGNTMNVTA